MSKLNPAQISDLRIRCVKAPCQASLDPTWSQTKTDRHPRNARTRQLENLCPFIRGWFRGQAGKELGNFKTQTIMSDFSRKTWSCWTDCLTEIVTIQKAPWKPSQGAWCNDPLALILSVSPSSFPHPQDGLCIWAPLIVSQNSFEQALLPHGSTSHTLLHTPCTAHFRLSFLSIIVIKILWPKAAYGIKSFIWLIFSRS